MLKSILGITAVGILLTQPMTIVLVMFFAYEANKNGI